MDMKHYTTSPEEVYDLPAETPDDYLERIRHRDIAHYCIQFIFSGQWAEIKIFPRWKERAFVPKKGNKTPDKQQKLNHRNAVYKLTRILNHNFRPYDDMFCTFTCDSNHLYLTDEECFEEAEKAVARIKYRYKKANLPLKAVYKVEIKKAKNSLNQYIKTSDGRQLYRPHLHIVLNKGVNPLILERAWGLGKNKRLELLRYSPEGFLNLAIYLCKDTKPGKRKWNSTTNLAKPPPPRTLYSSSAGSKKKVSSIADSMREQAKYFEELLPNYHFVHSEESYNEGSGVYMHARMEMKTDGKKH